MSQIGVRMDWRAADSNINIYFRKVYISKGEIENSRWVAKVHPPAELNLLAEEIAYKINKALKWKTIPKTKCLHPFSDFSGKHRRYAIMMRELLEFDPLHQGYTFQKYVHGCTVKEYTYFKGRGCNLEIPLNKRSYQKAYLLNLILGRWDTKPDNTMLNLSTGEFFEVDNELIGSNYGSSFTLNDLPLVPQEIEEDLLKEVLQLDVTKVRNKYRIKICKFISSWNQHAKKKLNLNDAARELEILFSQILQNINALRCSIWSLKDKKMVISCENLNREYAHLMRIKETKASRNPELYGELDEQLSELHAKL
jgi:hypothetical protein